MFQTHSRSHNFMRIDEITLQCCRSHNLNLLNIIPVHSMPIGLHQKCAYLSTTFLFVSTDYSSSLWPSYKLCTFAAHEHHHVASFLSTFSFWRACILMPYNFIYGFSLKGRTFMTCIQFVVHSRCLVPCSPVLPP